MRAAVDTVGEFSVRGRLFFMPSDVSFMQYMRAHGNTPGPTELPYLTGAVTGLVAGSVSAALLYWSGTSAGIADSVHTRVLVVLACDTALSVAAGVLYAFVFKRAANDRRGGWLFGMGYGFLLWMFAPVTLWQLTTGRPVVVGRDAVWLFVAEILFGLLLGLLYPRVHGLVQARLKSGSGAEQEREKSHA